MALTLTPPCQSGGMSSEAALEDLLGSVSALGADLDGLGGQELADRLVALERVIRRAEAAVVGVLDIVEQRGSWRADGHASVRGWVQGHGALV